MQRMQKLGQIAAYAALIWCGAIPSGRIASAARANQVVVPPVPVTDEGGENGTILNIGETAMQTVYAEALLSTIPHGSLITGVAFRSGGESPWPDVPWTWPHYEIQLSKSLNPPGSLSRVYAENMGPDVVTVRSGPLFIPLYSFPGFESGPNPFGMEFEFTTPYVYTGGDLLMTIRHDFLEYNPETFPETEPEDLPDYPGEIPFFVHVAGWVDIVGQFETIYTSDDSVDIVYESTTASEKWDLESPIARFSFMPAPEPATLVLASAGTAVLVAASMYRRRSKIA